MSSLPDCRRKFAADSARRDECAGLAGTPDWPKSVWPVSVRNWHYATSNCRPIAFDGIAGQARTGSGTFEPDHKLATIAPKWVVDRVHSDLVPRPGAYKEACTVDDGFAWRQIHRMGPIWILAGSRQRHIPVGAIPHSSIKVRREHDSSYPIGSPLHRKIRLGLTQNGLRSPLNLNRLARWPPLRQLRAGTVA